MTFKLYLAPGACSFVPHTLLEAAGVPFEPVLVKLHKGEHYTDEYKALNPRSQVPVLVVDGQVITQIFAIVSFLDARFPEQQFLPREALARARALETLAWMNSTVHPTFTHIFLPHKFVGDASLHPALKAFNTDLYRGMLGELQALVERAAAAGQAYLSGSHFGPLDAYALTLLRWGGIAGIDPAGFAVLQAHVERIAQLPPVARAIERERLQLNMYRPPA
jgi:glutathione S-transferase